MIRKVATGLLAAVILSTATGCMPSPFAQDVPSTNWQVDEKGNRIKITNPGGGVTAEDLAADKQAVKTTLGNFYAAAGDNKTRVELQETIKKAQGIKPSSDPEELKKQEAQMVEMYRPSLEPILSTIDTTGLTEVEEITLAMGVSMLGGMGLAETEVKVPDEIVILSGDTATVDVSKAEMAFQGEKAQSATSDGNSITHFVKKDGKWLINGKKLAETLGVEGSSGKVSASAG